MRRPTVRDLAYPGMLALLLTALASCKPCERSACEAFEQPAPPSHVQSGLAGVVAGEGDIIVDGCNECGWSAAELRVWPTSAPIADVAAARDVVNGGPPKLTFKADRRYEQALEAGHYLVCPIPSACIEGGVEFCSSPTTCAAVSIPSRGVVTVNVGLGNGGAGVRVFDPGSHTSRPEAALMLGYFQ
jgi:hypothetical protein